MAPFPIRSYTDNIFYLFIGPFLGYILFTILLIIKEWLW